MATPLYIHRYSLSSARALNSKSKRVAHQGILVRNGDGVGCVHPWPELGDPSLEVLLQCLRDGDFSHQILRNALTCAELDGEARQRGVSLFDGLEVPESHATLVDCESQLDSAVNAGFRVIKMKAGRDLDAECAWLREAHASYPDLRWRLDFNQNLNREQLDRYLGELPENLLEGIDFLEDPCADGECVAEVPVPLAADRASAYCEDPYSYVVVKPAVDAVEVVSQHAVKQKVRAVFTSYMDHPVGQSYAAYAAGKMAQSQPSLVDSYCGLMTHGVFEPDGFSEALGEIKPQWSAAAGTGLGFDDLLDEIQWEKLC